jgi:hypothetical protein
MNATCRFRGADGAYFTPAGTARGAGASVLDAPCISSVGELARGRGTNGLTAGRGIVISLLRFTLNGSRASSVNGGLAIAAIAVPGTARGGRHMAETPAASECRICPAHRASYGAHTHSGPRLLVFPLEKTSHENEPLQFEEPLSHGRGEAGIR